MKKYYLFVFLFLVGCAQLPSINSVQQSFIRENPEVKVTGITKEDTQWASAFHIKYTRSDGDREHEDIWHYHRVPEGWVADEKERSK